MAIFGSHKKSENNNSLTPTSSNKSLQNISLANALTTSNHTSQDLRLSINIESPPVVLYGPPAESSGSLLSGSLKMEILQKKNSGYSNSSTNSLSVVRSNSGKDDTVKIVSVQLSLVQSIQFGKPFLPPSNTLLNCSDCRAKRTELARWDVLTEPSEFTRGTEHGYPFSHLLPGSLPQTTLLSNINTMIDYELIAKVVISKGKKIDDSMKLRLPVIVKRSIIRGPDRNSLRIFPPTEVTASLVLPNVLYPKSSFPIELKLDNICTLDRRWRMRKLNWRLEENVKVKLNSCSLHVFKLKVVEDHTRKLNLQKLNTGGKRKAVVASPVPSLSPLGIHAPQQIASQLTTQPNLHPQTSNSSDLQPHISNNGISPMMTQTPDSRPIQTTRNELDELLNNNEDEVPPPSELDQPVLDTEDLQVPKAPTHSLYLEETRHISHGEIKSGWKSDFTNKGRIELVAEISLNNLSTIGLSSSLNNLNSIDSTNFNSPHYNTKNLLANINSNCACDIHDDTLGVYVSHMLIVEVVVAEELLHGSNVAPSHHLPKSLKSNTSPTQKTTSPSMSSSTGESSSSKPQTSPNSSSASDNKIGIPTGAARVLRMQFKVVLTERSGLGIAWDDEVPPTYQDVRLLSPPSYDQTLKVADIGDSTPSLDSLQFPEPVARYGHRTPGVIYGSGQTPGVSFNLDNTDPTDLEGFQELRI